MNDLHGVQNRQLHEVVGFLESPCLLVDHLLDLLRRHALQDDYIGAHPHCGFG